MIALVDCDNFYVSCERVFNPSLEKRPVVVLSNNDGCIVSRSKEVKSAGIVMGEPFFKAKERLSQINAVVLSSNYELYSDMSSRVMKTLSTFVPRIEIYSIDEAFLDFSHVKSEKAVKELACEIRRTVLQNVGIPVSIGVSLTKTLAKLADEVAKKNSEFNGIRALIDEKDIGEVLRATSVADIWGIGSASAAKLAKNGILTAFDLKNTDSYLVKRLLGVVGLRTALELSGQPCVSFEEFHPERKSLCRSRSFGRPVKTLDEFIEAISCRSAEAARTLRAENLVAMAVTVFAEAGRFSANGHVFDSASELLAVSVRETAELISYAAKLAKKIYKAGVSYSRAGVVLGDIRSYAIRRGDLFEPETKVSGVSDLMDSINRRFGKDSIFLAAEGISRPWEMSRNMRSPRYTTRWDELPVAR